MRFEMQPTGDGSLTVFDKEAGECFKSRHAAKLEAEHVFFRPAVRENPWYGKANPFRVLELGLGLGTNFQHFLSQGFRGEFLTIERDLSGARYFLEQEPVESLLHLVEDGFFQGGATTASLRRGEFSEIMAELASAGYRAHAILFDPFSPRANPEAWTAGIFRQAAALLAPGGRLVTYSVSRAAKDAALAAGLLVEKRELPPELRKRSALLAMKPGTL
jgi:tRNA U34 5-methylaminomethyl-2-thiouridine-forming methyltransferase MnmC